MRLIIDMDDVLTDCTGQFEAWYLRDFGVALSKSQLSCKKIDEAVDEEHKSVVRSYPHTKHFFGDMKVIEGSQSMVKTLNEHYDVYIATLAMEFKYSLEEKHDWLEQHFSFIPSKRWVFCGDKSIIKGEIIVDDNDYNLRSFTGRKIIFTAPHNETEDDFERARNWDDVGRLLIPNHVLF